MAALDCADPILQQAEAFLHSRQGSETDLEWVRSAMEGAKQFGLHVPHLFDKVIADLVKALVDARETLVHLVAELVEVLLRCGAVVFTGHPLHVLPLARELAVCYLNGFESPWEAREGVAVPVPFGPVTP